jgi:Tfp pilus assembly protein FimT
MISPRRRESGFSLLEICMVLMVACVLGGFAVIGAAGILPGMNANKSMHQVVAHLRSAREQAVVQRRRVQVVFPNSNQIRLVRHNAPASLGTTELGTTTLENKCEFRLFGGIPDTPDIFGKSSAIHFGGTDTLFFLPDGTLVDANGTPRSGSIFFGMEDKPATARAVTVLGATGRIRSYRWNGTAWIQ